MTLADKYKAMKKAELQKQQTAVLKEAAGKGKELDR